MKKAKDFRDMSEDEIQVALVDAQKALFNLVNEMKTSKKMEKPHLLQQKRKEIARMLTILTEKQWAQQTSTV